MSDMTDLEWLARNVHEWPKGLIEECACRFEMGSGGVAKAIATRRRPCGEDDDTEWFTRDQWQAERERIQNKPGWDGAPKEADKLFQNKSGRWYFASGKFDSHTDAYWVFEIHYPTENKGEVLGDWRKMLEHRPCAANSRDSDEALGKSLSVYGRECRFSFGGFTDTSADMSAFINTSTPKSKYHRQIAPGIWVDVYDVIDAFSVTCPALQHLIRKALAPGRRGHKDTEQDLRDIIVSADRALELHQTRKSLHEEA